MIKIKDTKLIGVGDWDDLVTETYGRPYNFQQQDDCKDRGTHHLTVPAGADDYENDTIPEEINGSEMGVSFAAWLARDPKEWHGESDDHHFISMFWQRNFYPDVQMIANDLHEKGLLPAGEYCIEIDW
jgi:hypothetical protein